MTEIYILLAGIGIGSLFGFVVKMYFCIYDTVYRVNDNNIDTYDSDIYDSDIDVDSERNMMNDTRGYIQYLENMLNNSTNVTTTSVSLQPVDISFNNITSESIFVVPHSPTQMMPPTILTPRFTTPTPSAPFAPVYSDVIYMQEENIVGDTVWRDVDHNDRV
jgi:hypothetical protein